MCYNAFIDIYMVYTKMLNQDELKSILEYNPNTGIFVWKISSGTAKRGTVAGYDTQHGYFAISYKGKKYLSHRLAWLYMTGRFPKDCIDHINGNGHDNRFSNLREATFSQNQLNRKLSKSNKSGLTGASWNSSHKKWCAFIRIEGKNKNLGSFNSAEEAHHAYVMAKLEVHNIQHPSR